jgi:DNA processing protein
VFAVPGEITNSLSAGTNALLRLGAIPATCAGDVLELFDIAAAQSSHADLGATAQAVLDLLGDSPLTADEIARAAGIEPAPLSASLMELELAGRVTLEDGVYRAAV